MVGGIIGDIIGSIYESRNIKTKDFELFGSNCDYTDDTILTIATAQWLIETSGDGDSSIYISDTDSISPPLKGATVSASNNG